MNELLVEAEQLDTNLRVCISRLERVVHKSPLEPAAAGDGFAEDLIRRIQESVAVFFNLRDTSYIQELFNKHANQTTNLMTMDQTHFALRELGVQSTAEEAAVLFETYVADGDGGLNLQDFLKAVKYPSKVEQWTDSLPLSKLLAHCLSFKTSDDPLREISRLSSEELRSSTNAYCDSLQTILADAVDELKKCLAEMDKAAAAKSNEARSKFQTFKMSSGGVQDFHNGLQGRIGAPHPSLAKGMEEEHCVKAGFDDEFTSSNYGVRTTPRKEFEIVTGRRACPPEDTLDLKGRSVRIVRRIEELTTLALARKAGLTTEEVVAVVLYTGPMFQVYNTILRQYPGDVFGAFRAGGNLFATTIHILVSAVIKVARTTRLPPGLELFRGLGGLAELPHSFLRVDANGCRGYVEWGFLSTTSNRAVAVEYSGVVEGRPQAMVLRMKMGAIDRGACIAEFSQYPGEREYLWVPCSFLEPEGAPRVELVEEAGGAAGGAVTVVPVRVNANLKARTVDELRTQKQALHLASFRYLLAETGRDLERIAEDEGAEARLAADGTREYDLPSWLAAGGRPDWLLPGMTDGARVTFTVAGLRARIVQQCSEVLERHAAADPERFNADEAFRHIVAEMLETKAAAVNTLRGYLENPVLSVENVMRIHVTTWQRVYLGFLDQKLPEEGEARAVAAGRLCRAMGVMQAAAVDEVDAEGLTPLMRAASDGAGERSLRCLVAARADVNCHDTVVGRTALWLAAAYGHAEAVVTLARLGGDVNAGARLLGDCTPAWVAASAGHTAVIEALGRLGSDLNRATMELTPLGLATLSGHSATVAALRRLGAV